MDRTALGPFGVSIDVDDDGRQVSEAQAVERLGYRTAWIAGGQLDRLDRVAEVVGGTSELLVATGVISPDVYDADAVVSAYAAVEADAPGRFVVGVGASQREPALAGLQDYLDRLDHARPPVPPARRLLAALGPRKLDVARDRCSGAMTLLVTPQDTQRARRRLGDGAVLVVHQLVVLDEDPDRARATARQPLAFLSRVAGYRANFARMGFADSEITDLDDRLVDELVAWGDTDAIAERVAAHRAAGADHVVLGVRSDGDQPGTVEVAGELAGRLVPAASP